MCMQMMFLFFLNTEMFMFKCGINCIFWLRSYIRTRLFPGFGCGYGYHIRPKPGLKLNPNTIIKFKTRCMQVNWVWVRSENGYDKSSWAWVFRLIKSSVQVLDMSINITPIP